MPELTKAGSHVANAKGYAAGKIIEEGDNVPPGVPVGSWMDEVKAEAPAKKAKASEAEV